MFNNEYEAVGIDGEMYTFVTGCNIGWRVGSDEGVYMGQTTVDYFITDGKIVVRCEGIATWDGSEGDELYELLDEWLAMVNMGEVGYTKII